MTLIHRNPLFLKSVANRLRLKPTIAWGTIVVLVSAFIYMVGYIAPIRRSSMDAHDAAGAAILWLLIIQGIILMFGGTGSVAHGVAEEREQGLIDYQRLHPMSNADKIMGYLFGLPVREYFLFGLTIPFTLLAALGGGVNLIRLGRLYLVFLALVLVYHLSGFVAGMVASKPRRASWFGRGAILVMYLLLPQVAHFGFTIFGYLTILPTGAEVARAEWGTTAEFAQAKSWESMPFFGIELHPTIFTLALQVVLIALFVAILLRKWRHDSAQALSKWQSIAVFSGVQVLVLGSLSPLLMNPMRLFVLAAALRRENPNEALVAVYYIFWCLAAFVGTLLLNTVTPNRDGLVVGWRRARKVGRKKPSRWADKSGSAWVAMAFGLLGAGSYAVLVALTGSRSEFFGTISPAKAVVIPGITFLCVMLIVQGIRQTFGARGLALAIFGIGILPGMLSIVLIAAFSSPQAALYVGMPSPPVSLGITTMYAFDLTEDDFGLLPYVVAGLVANVGMALYFWRRQYRCVGEAEESTRGS